MSISHFNKIKSLIEDAQNSGLEKTSCNLSGYSGEKLLGALQRIVKYQESVGAGYYLEVGVFQGLTLLSVANVMNGNLAFGIDNFSFFDSEKKNQEIIEERAEANGLENYRLINSDYEDALENLESHIGNKKISTYFIDGPHDYRSQLSCLNLAKPYLSDFCVIIIDDCNYEHVRLANRDFLVSNPNYKLIFESYTKCHPTNMKPELLQSAKDGWWNGVNIIVHDPDNVLDAMLPNTVRDRLLYENEHLIHSAKYSFLAPDAVYFIQSIASFKLINAVKLFLKIIINIKKNKRSTKHLFHSLNTFSDELTNGNFNPKL